MLSRFSSQHQAGSPHMGRTLTPTLGQAPSRLRSGKPHVSCQVTDVNVGSGQSPRPYAVFFQSK